jgi:hypothetical protein
MIVGISTFILARAQGISNRKAIDSFEEHIKQKVPHIHIFIHTHAEGLVMHIKRKEYTYVHTYIHLYTYLQKAYQTEGLVIREWRPSRPQSRGMCMYVYIQYM